MFSVGVHFLLYSVWYHISQTPQNIILDVAVCVFCVEFEMYIVQEYFQVHSSYDNFDNCGIPIYFSM